MNVVYHCYTLGFFIIIKIIIYINIFSLQGSDWLFYLKVHPFGFSVLLLHALINDVGYVTVVSCSNSSLKVSYEFLFGH